MSHKVGQEVHSWSTFLNFFDQSGCEGGLRFSLIDECVGSSGLVVAALLGTCCAAGTDYAKLKKPDGCSLYVYDKGEEVNYVLRDGQKMGCSWWWLRTQGNQPSRAHFIGPGCSICSYANVSLARDGVRPAIKLKLE